MTMLSSFFRDRTSMDHSLTLCGKNRSEGVLNEHVLILPIRLRSL
jgi:hypothetical protein